MTRKRRNPRKSAKRKPAPPRAKPDPFSGIIDAHAKALGLKIDPAWKPAIGAHLQVITRFGAMVREFKLPDGTDPAPVFKP